MAAPAQRRGHVRVDDVLPLLYAPLSRQEFEEVRTQILSKSASLHSLGSVERIVEAGGRAVDATSPLWQALTLLDRKLDHLLREVQSLGAGGEGEMRDRPVNLSGTGMRFPSHEPYHPGQLLRLEMRIPLSPPLPITCVAEVIQAKAKRSREGEGPSHWLSVKFVAINREDQEELTRYTFQRQRELLRASREEAGG